MIEKNQAEFINLTASEISGKFSILAKENLPIKIWKQNEEAVVARVESYSFEEVIKIIVTKNDFPEGWIGKEVLLHFIFNSVHYFANCFPRKECENPDRITLEIGGTIYKTEKRANERLLTFPHHHVYAYFKIAGAKPLGNVVSINRQKEENVEVFKKFSELNKKRAVELIQSGGESIEDLVNDELAGFRVLDISSTGISFLANEKEGEFFVHSKGSALENVSFYILLDGKPYTIKDAEVVYHIPYINPRAEKVHMIKVGMTFGQNDNLSALLESMLNEGGTIGEVQKSFETLVGDES